MDLLFAPKLLPTWIFASHNFGWYTNIEHYFKDNKDFGIEYFLNLNGILFYFKLEEFKLRIWEKQNFLKWPESIAVRQSVRELFFKVFNSIPFVTRISLSFFLTEDAIRGVCHQIVTSRRNSDNRFCWSSNRNKDSLWYSLILFRWQFWIIFFFYSVGSPRKEQDNLGISSWLLMEHQWRFVGNLGLSSLILLHHQIEATWQFLDQLSRTESSWSKFSNNLNPE